MLKMTFAATTGPGATGTRAPRAAALAALAAAGVQGGFDRAQAEILDGVDAYAGIGVMKDDNLFRREVDVRDDARVRTGAGFEAVLQRGRQTLTLDADVHDNRFDAASELDYVGRAAAAALDWEAGRRLDGSIGYAYSRDLTPFEQFRVIEKDLTVVNEGEASIGVFVAPRVQVRADVRDADWRHTAGTWRFADLEEKEYGADLMLRTSAGAFVGIGRARIDGEYVNRPFGPESVTDNAYDQTRSEVIVEWHTGGRAALDARIGRTSREQRHLPDRDFDAVTGAFGLELTVSPKTRLTLGYSRDIRSIDEADARAALVDRFDFAPQWQATPNVRLSARVMYRRQDFIGLDGVAGDDRLDEEMHVETRVEYALGARYVLEAGAGRGARDSTRPGLDYDYLYGNVGLRVTF